MSTAISIMGGVGLFLLGMTVMTDGLKAMAGSALRTVLGKAAATPLRGAFWGAIATLIVQSSSATTMTTIGLVSAGLLTFPQGLGLVFGANVGTTGTGWLVALIGVRVSLTAAALPMIFVGALVKLLGSGRIAGAGAALAGFALVLFGLTTLQQGMGGLAERLNPADLPTVLAAPGAAWWSGMLGVLALVLVGLAMTAVMQSSTASIALTLSAHYAGAVGLDQACALIIGQNIGTATSSAMAAIGASATAKRLAVAYILFKLIAAVIALLLFPIVTPLLVRASNTIDGVTLLAGYHTAYNIIGVMVLLPVIDSFTRFVERMLPDRNLALTRCLDPSALTVPIAAEEAVRRTVARALATVCQSLGGVLGGTGSPDKVTSSAKEAAEALGQAQEFMCEVSGPPESPAEQRRLTITMHALDHASRLAEVAAETGTWTVRDGVGQAAQLSADALKCAAEIAAHVAAAPGVSLDGEPRREPSSSQSLDMQITAPTQNVLLHLEQCAKDLRALQKDHRVSTLSAIANGSMTASEAMARVDTVRRLDAITHHAWRSASQLAEDVK
ncbi:Na/Pi symporter [Bradyrhizobium sp.]|jgi:phosphate:Na+ symporter|uniref:Na/Pi cotransporter family protein n=1 Tax=Bradyrhizobium sp. TaxID=376 RepID=UPI002DDD5DEA|nr:Na/Pi symporter [Bradyrhizobium sp.]HEV2154479.1 Na/Pi symporter [Bradyrhizobium sp.]